jgi:IS5 family transposase
MTTTWQPGFFDDSEREQRLLALGDPLHKLEQIVDFEMFRPLLEKALEGPLPRGPGGRPRFDAVMMFKILLLQRLYQLSDEQAEYQINDRQSFSRFLGLRGAAPVPDFSTIWRFRERLVERDSIKPLFDLFNQKLASAGLIGREGVMVDASFVEVPRQRNSREDNALIKSGKTPPDWAGQPRKTAHKDVDARWAKKNDRTHYGYKNHVKVDVASRFIVDYTVTSASVHDSQALDRLVGPEDSGKGLFGDSAYRSAEIEAWLEELEVSSFIHEKASRGRPLTRRQKLLNRLKSSVRATVEHVFGMISTCFGSRPQRVIGLRRNAALIGLTNLAHNLVRHARIAAA